MISKFTEGMKTNKESELVEQMRKEIEKGTVRHRRCDICGCELEIPDIGVFSREVLNTVACTACTNTERHLEFLEWIAILKKTYSKEEILELIEDGLNQIFGYDSSIFTTDEWKELFITPMNCGMMDAKED